MSIYNICHVMGDENNSEYFDKFVKSKLIPLRNLGIGITDDHIQQYRQIERWKSDENSSRKYKLTIERRLDKKHFDAVF